ncbi:MAG: hypothetical protein KGN16_20615 [Burkholderiales bacterium]|nr:hypothetical protein [Burkholderiales bacterium]
MFTRARHLSCLLAAAWALASPPAQASDNLYVVVAASNPVQALSLRDVVALYTGRTRAFPNARMAVPLDFPRDSGQRQAFYWTLTHQDLAQINSYWSRLFFSGQLQPPRAVADEAEMRAALKRDPSALGYLMHEPADPALRVVLTVPLAAEPK